MGLSTQQSLELWRAVMIAGLHREHADLTARQFALLLHVYLMPPPHTVRGLSAALGLSKPAITRALDRLGRYDYLRRKRDQADKRNVLIQRTVKGAVYLREFGDLAAETAASLQPPAPR
jgi:DNA-binding MarR family transcriptional regulator